MLNITCQHICYCLYVMQKLSNHQLLASWQVSLAELSINLSLGLALETPGPILLSQPRVK